MGKNRPQTHALLLLLVGGYILYTAWQLFDRFIGGAEDIAPAAAVTAIAVFGIAGIGILIYAWFVWRKAKEEDGRDDGNSVK